MIFYRVEEAFQDYAVGRSRKSISALMDIRPDYANLKTASGLEQLSPERVQIGDRIVVKPGEKIPLDGVVAEGFSTLDTSVPTGEFLPREKGSAVLSGSINKSGLLTIEVTKVFGESTVSKILNLVQNTGAKNPLPKTASLNSPDTIRLRWGSPPPRWPSSPAVYPRSDLRRHRRRFTERHPAGFQPVIGTMNAARLKDCVRAADMRITREEWYEIYRAAGNTLP
jgi:hypothetical protein